jgi:hypothetical protein
MQIRPVRKDKMRLASAFGLTILNVLKFLRLLPHQETVGVPRPARTEGGHVGRGTE